MDTLGKVSYTSSYSFKNLEDGISYLTCGYDRFTVYGTMSGSHINSIKSLSFSDGTNVCEKVINDILFRVTLQNKDIITEVKGLSENADLNTNVSRDFSISALLDNLPSIVDENGSMIPHIEEQLLTGLPPFFDGLIAIPDMQTDVAPK